jgi:hypothetical protein
MSTHRKERDEWGTRQRNDLITDFILFCYAFNALQGFERDRAAHPPEE